MAKYPNQKTYVIDKKKESEYFASYDKLGISTACSRLNGSGFKVWCYLLSNIDEFKWSVSPQHAQNEWGISRSSFYDGIKELEEKGFIDKEKRIIHQMSEFRINESESDFRQKNTNVGLEMSENNQSNNKSNNNNNNNKDRDINIAVVKPIESEFIF